MKNKYILVIKPICPAHFSESSNLIYKQTVYPFVAKVVKKNDKGNLVFLHPYDHRADSEKLWAVIWFQWKFITPELKYLL